MINFNYEQTVMRKAFAAHKRAENIESKLRELTNELDDMGWMIQSVSYQLFRECGVYELYHSNDRLNGRFVSDIISDAFYLSDSLDEVYDKITYILLQLESQE